MIDNARTWSTIKRRAWLIGMVAVGCLCLSIALSYTLTPVYRSEGRLLVEQGDIPVDLVQTTVRGLAEERIELVRSRVMDGKNIVELIARHQLYANSPMSDGEKNRLFRDRSSVVVEQMADGTISFLVAFDDEDPNRAKDVAESLTTLFQQENVSSRTESAASTATFLENEADRLTGDIARYEERIAEYKEQNRGRLPEQVELNIQFLDRAQGELDNVERDLRMLEQRREIAEADLARARATTGFAGGEPPPPGSPGRLRYLQSEYLRLLTTYSSEHPAIRKIRREIEVLDPNASVLSVPVIEEQIRLKQAELSDLRNRYSADHPDVIAAQRTLERLQEQRVASGTSDGGTVQDTDPEIRGLVAVVQGTVREIEALRARSQALREKIAEYETRLTNAPQVQRELLSLTRGYEQLQQKYDEFKLKQTQVELAVNVEVEQRAGRFALITSPTVSDSPVRPNRPALIFLGLLFGVGGGLLVAIALEAADKTLRDDHDVRDAWLAPPLTTIPQIRNQLDTRRHATKVAAYAITMGVMVTGTALLVIA